MPTCTNLGTIIGAPLTNWALVKASLSYCHGGLSIQKTSFYAPGVLWDNISVSALSGGDFCVTVMVHLITCGMPSSNWPDWFNQNYTDKLLRQRTLSPAIYEPFLHHSLSSCPGICYWGLTQYTAHLQMNG